MKLRRFRLACWLPLVSVLHAAPGADLAEVNGALRSWVQLMDADRPYLLFDRGAGRIDLYHGAAKLRSCQVVADTVVAGTPLGGELRGHLRQYRPAHPWATPSSGPFDWEQVLADEAGSDAALFFSNQLLIFSSAAWERPRGPAIRVAPGDLRTLYNTLKKGTPLILLPPGWREANGE